jgi:hypothetical protein
VLNDRGGWLDMCLFCKEMQKTSTPPFILQYNPPSIVTWLLCSFSVDIRPDLVAFLFSKAGNSPQKIHKTALCNIPK